MKDRITVTGYDRHIRLRKRKEWNKRSVFPKIMAANFLRTKKICKLNIEDAHSLGLIIIKPHQNITSN